jgi:hypothetical protein
MNPETEGSLCDSEAARLLPWYVTGRLAVSDRVRVAGHLVHCAVCRDDLREQQTLRARLKAEGSVELAPQAGLAATLARIDELGRELGADPAQPAVQLRRVTPPLQRRMRITQWLAAAVIVQAIGLALVGRALLLKPAVAPGAGYQTLANSGPQVGAARIRAVFAKSMTIEALRTVLRAQHLVIVAGPSEAGVFTLAFETGGGTTRSALQALRADPQLQFAEPVTDGGVPAP